MTRGRLLVLTPRFPYPVIGGDRLRIHAICRALARDHSLTLLSLCERREDFDPALVDDAVFDRIERVHLPRWRSLAQTALAIPGRTPLQVAYYRSPAFARRVAALLPQHDLALAHLIRTGDHLLRERTIPTVLEMTDAISMNYARVREHGVKGIRARIYAIEQARLRAYEARMPRYFDTVSLIADTDAANLWGNDLPSNLVVASNGVDCDALPFRDRTGNPPVAVFIGNMHSAQNMDACRYFVQDILPLLPEATVREFRIVGRIRDGDAAWLRQHPRVTVTGEVASIPAEVADAAIGVCPVRIGAGVQNKVLEYMALGLPTVSSPVGHEGLAAVASRDLLVAATPTDFVAAIEQIITDPALATALARHARQFVEERHGWDATLRPLTDRIGAMIATSTRSRIASSARS
ncbi:glycosyltransferase [Sphingomonas sp. 2378]|uniref:glycosyltransferase n=1 Tax=Sphingomonas sp. 2378 TaxID=1219748 RepID=UPI00311AC873